MHILYFDPSGYLIFKTKEFEEVGIAIQSVKRSYDDIKKFSSLIKLEKYYPFRNDDEANANLTYINKENSIPPTMIKFISSYGIKHIQSLGIEFSNLTESLKDKFQIKVSSNALVIEIIRCIRCHIHSILKENCNELIRKSIISKVNNDVRGSTSDGKLIASYNFLKNIESTIPLKAAKLRLLVQPFYPELKLHSLINDNDFPKFISIFFDDKIIDKWPYIKQILGNDKILPIEKALKNTIGREIGNLDSNLLKECADELLFTIEQYDKCKKNAYNITKALAPNLTTYLELSAKMNNENEINLSATEMISKAGSLKKLAEKSSTSIHTQNKNNDSLLRRSKNYNSPRSSIDKIRSVHLKTLSDKCALAARVDYFGSQSENERLDDSFGRECYKNHVKKMNTYANNNAIVMNITEKDDLKLRVKKYKLKRKEKKKMWRKRKNDKQKDILYRNSIDIDMED